MSKTQPEPRYATDAQVRAAGRLALLSYGGALRELARGDAAGADAPSNPAGAGDNRTRTADPD